MADRQLIIVDCESTGLRPVDIAVEVAWLNVDTQERGQFIPQHDVSWVLKHGEERALEINGYRERIEKAQQDDGTQVRRLHTMLKDNAMAGSNPRADSAWLDKVFVHSDLSREPYHYRLPDVSSYAAGVLGINVRCLPGLAAVCELLGVTPGDHTASGDVVATAQCFAILQRIAEGRQTT